MVRPDEGRGDPVYLASHPYQVQYRVRRCKRGLEVRRQGEPADSGNGKERDASLEDGLCDRFCQAAARSRTGPRHFREMYYISEGWKRAKFGAQDESNFLVEDLEIISDVPREGFHLRPEENGASIYGPMRIREPTRRGLKLIHCQDDVGSAGYSIPNNVENLELVDHDAKFVIAMETGGMYDRLIENGFDEEHNAILLHLKGQPARFDAQAAQPDKPDLEPADPRLYRWGPVVVPDLRVGCLRCYQECAHVRAARDPEGAVPRVQPSDIRDYNLPSDKLSDKDVEALNAELTDPRFATEYWKKQINLQPELGLKSEQQAFAARGLDFVTKKYLPARLSEMSVI